MPIHPRLQALLDAHQADLSPACAAASSKTPVIAVDTNAVLDLFYWRDPAAAPLAALLAGGRVRAVRCRAGDQELALVLSRPSLGAARSQRKADFSAPSEEALPELEKRVEALSSWLAAASPVGGEALQAARSALSAAKIFCRDPEDQKFLELGAAARAALLVTKDRLVLKALKKTARAFGLAGAAPADAPAKLGFRL